MSSPVTELLQSVRVTESRRSGALQIFGLGRDKGAAPEYATLDEALEGRVLEVSEINEGGSVPVIKVSNAGEKAVFLMAGEQLVGAKQNRVLNASMMVPARSEAQVPVTCGEAGRWGYQSRRFGSGGNSSHHVLRSMMARQVGLSYRRSGTPAADQRAVWNEVSRKLGAVGAVSPTQSLQEAYETRRGSLETLTRDLGAPEGCSGAVFVLAGRIAGLDLFDRPETLAKLWPKIILSYAVDALECGTGQPQEVSAGEVSAWIAGAARAKAEPYRSPGIGDDVRVEGGGMVGAGLVIDGHPVHVEIYPEHEPSRVESSAPQPA